MASDWLTVGGTLGGVAFGGGLNWLRDVRAQQRADDAAANELMAGARLVYLELTGISDSIVNSETLYQVYEGEPFPPELLDPLAARAHWERYSSLLARQQRLDPTVIDHAYDQARFAHFAIVEAGVNPSDFVEGAQEAVRVAHLELGKFTRFSQTTQKPPLWRPRAR